MITSVQALFHSYVDSGASGMSYSYNELTVLEEYYECFRKAYDANPTRVESFFAPVVSADLVKHHTENGVCPSLALLESMSPDGRDIMRKLDISKVPDGYDELYEARSAAFRYTSLMNCMGEEM